MSMDEISLAELDTTEILEYEYEYEYVNDDKTRLAKYQINKFFKDKEYYYGGLIPLELLISKRYIDLLLDIEGLIKKIDAVYQAIEGIFYDEEKLSIPSDIQYVLSLLSMCAKAKIPRDYAFGIIIMHLELCEGIEVDI